jgi:hypothetical protein
MAIQKHRRDMIKQLFANGDPKLAWLASSRFSRV